MHRSSSSETNSALPDFFLPLFWSYEFTRLRTKTHRHLIILNAINYGGLRHWRWIARHYDKKIIHEALEHAPLSAIRPGVRKLALLLFRASSTDHVS